MSAVLAAATSARRNTPQRLLVIDPAQQAFADHTLADLPHFLNPGDVLVLNDSATLPAALRVNANLELRLATQLDSTPRISWQAVLFGSGDHRLPTELRGPAPSLNVGQRLSFGPVLSAHITHVDARNPRLVVLAFEQRGAVFWQELYRSATPVQYAYLQTDLQLWDVQTRFGSAPWSVEMPSAGRPLSFDLLGQLRAQGVMIAMLRHAAGLSSTGEVSLDHRLPLPERYALPQATIDAVHQARAGGNRVIAVGTSVVRALEANAEQFGSLRAGDGRAQLLLSAHTPRRVVDGILSGLHEPGSSHFALLEAFAPAALLSEAAQHAAQQAYLQHEFGDSCLVLNQALPQARELN